MLDWFIRFNAKLEDQSRLFCCMLWEIWNDRNRLVHGKPVKLPSQIISLASDLSLEFGNQARVNSAQGGNEVVRWKAWHGNIV